MASLSIESRDLALQLGVPAVGAGVDDGDGRAVAARDVPGGGQAAARDPPLRRACRPACRARSRARSAPGRWARSAAWRAARRRRRARRAGGAGCAASARERDAADRAHADEVDLRHLGAVAAHVACGRAARRRGAHADLVLRVVERDEQAPRALGAACAAAGAIRRREREASSARSDGVIARAGAWSRQPAADSVDAPRAARLARARPAQKPSANFASSLIFSGDHGGSNVISLLTDSTPSSGSDELLDLLGDLRADRAGRRGQRERDVTLPLSCWMP